MKTINICMFLLILSFTVLKAQTIREYGQHQDFVYPGNQTNYEAIPPAGATLSKITWYVTNGSFSQTSDVTTKEGHQAVVDVFWKNPACSNGNPPKGNIYAQIDYVLAGNSGSEKSNSLSQNILSYNGVYPPGLLADKALTIPFGINNIRVYLAKQFDLPYTYSNGDKISVSEFEWTLPEKWTDKYGNSNTFISGGYEVNITTDYFNEGTVKLRGVNSNALDDYTNYSQITFKRNFSYITYPSSIKYGTSQSYTYKVTPVEGVEYEWKLPAGWTKTSGGNTNIVTLTKSACATSAAVQVRLKAGFTYSQWYTCPNTTILSPDMTIPTIEQFRDVNISVNIPNSQIQSFSVSGDGVNTVSGQGTNTLVCRFDKTGSNELSVNLTLNGCGSFSFKKTVQVSEVELQLSGPDILCPLNSGSNIYSINVPAGASVSWSSWGGSIVGGNTSATCNIKGATAGPGHVGVTVTIRGVTVSTGKNIEIASTPQELKPTISYTNSGSNTILEVSVAPYSYGIQGYIWIVQQYPSGSSQTYTPGLSGYRLSVPYGSYRVECRIITGCGQTSNTLYVNTPGYSSTAYPNPVDQTLFIEIDNPEENILSSFSALPSSAESIYDIRLFNIQGTLLRSLKSSGGQTSVDVSNLPNGNYFLHIYKDSETIPVTHKIVIRH